MEGPVRGPVCGPLCGPARGPDRGRISRRPPGRAPRRVSAAATPRRRPRRSASATLRIRSRGTPRPCDARLPRTCRVPRSASPAVRAHRSLPVMPVMTRQSPGRARSASHRHRPGRARPAGASLHRPRGHSSKSARGRQAVTDDVMSAGEEKRARRDEIVGRGTGAETLGGIAAETVSMHGERGSPAFSRRLNS